MKKTRRILAILMVCAMLVGLMSVGTVAEDYINANDKWLGSGINCYLLNPSVPAGDTDGLWYQLNIEQDGLLFLEHKYKDVDYTITMTVNGVTYKGGAEGGVSYNAPLVSLPVKTGDEAIINIVTKDAAAGTVYANMKVVTGTSDDPVKVKSSGIVVYVAAGERVYYQDDSLQAVYAASGVLVSGNVADTTFYNVTRNTENGNVFQDAFTDTDGDNVIETVLGGSLGSAGAPPIKPAWAIENNSTEDQIYTITLVNDAHECNWDDNTDTDCNTCGAVREATSPLVIGGSSVSTDVNGLACLFDVVAAGMAVNGTTAVYDNATFCGDKLVSMGAVVCNNYEDGAPLPTIDDADGQNVLNISAKYLVEVNEAEGTASYAIRIIKIPEAEKDTCITFIPYVVVEDATGAQSVQYITEQVYQASYNDVANP